MPEKIQDIIFSCLKLIMSLCGASALKAHNVGFIFIFLLLSSSLFAQKEHYNWVLSNGLKINFNQQPPEVITDMPSFATSPNSTSMSDKNGNLLFYINRGRIYNFNNQVIFSQYLERNSALKLASPTILDTAQLCITYEFKFAEDSLNPNVKRNDIQTLLIGKNISKYFSQSYYDVSVKIKKNGYKGNYRTLNSCYCGFEVYKNYPKDYMTVTDVGNTLIMGDDFLYEEEIPKINWTIEQDTMTIATYLCQKATAYFRGRFYTAWFTSDIPISNGPWKLGGLAGLILKVEDSKNHYSLECIGIKKPNKIRPIEMYNYKYKRTTWKDWLKVYDLLFHETKAFLQSVNPAIPYDGRTLLYNPMEFEEKYFEVDRITNEIISNAKVECIYSYKVNAPLKADTTKKRTLNYYTILQTNGVDSKFWDWHSFKKDSIIFSSKSIDKYTIDKLKWKYYFNVENLFTPVIFKNYGEDKFMVTDEVNFSDFSYTEKNANQKIELKEDTLTIGKYLCKKALINYAGNIWTVWYAPEIPISDGPWKLHGLPGLILKAQDKGNIHNFEVVFFRKSNRPIYLKRNIEELKISRKEYLQEKNEWENLDTEDIVSFKDFNPKSSTLNMQGKRLLIKRDVKYIPLELQ